MLSAMQVVLDERKCRRNAARCRLAMKKLFSATLFSKTFVGFWINFQVRRVYSEKWFRALFLNVSEYQTTRRHIQEDSIV
jgi:hypothetical protein